MQLWWHQPAKALVIGDVMLDLYWLGSSSRVSPEAPVCILNEIKEQARLGGAANVAANLKAWGVETTLVGLIGHDKHGNTLKSLLIDSHIDSGLIQTDDYQTICKLRCIAQGQHLLRIDQESAAPIHSKLADQLLAKIKDMLFSQQFDIVVFSDYNKGMFGVDPQHILAWCKEQHITTIVDTKHQYWQMWKGVDYITPNEKEFAAVCGIWSTEQQLEQRCQQFQQLMPGTNLLLTRSGKGISLFQHGSFVHYPAIAQEVIDVTGAGDVVLAVFASALARKLTVADAIPWSNTAAGYSVSHLGTVTVHPDDLHHQRQMEQKIVTLAELKPWRKKIKNQAMKLVLTNGCFDLLHAGHIRLLQEAKRCGDYLVVAINDDQSIQAIKGKKRPIYPELDRARMLAALEVVDKVIIYSEATPHVTLQAIQPDILVKGPDYTVDGVVGHEIVYGYGGQVKIIDIELAGISTTATIAKINRIYQVGEVTGAS